VERLQEFFCLLARPFTKFPLGLNAAFAQANVLACRLVTRGVRLYCPIVSTHARRFPPPWSVEEQPACFVVRDHNDQQLPYVNFEDEPGRRSAATDWQPPILECGKRSLI
jgi:hypothetical protein